MEGYNKELCEERHSRIEERLSKHGEQIDSLEKCVIKLTEMTERYDKQASDSQARIRAIENKPMATVGKICAYILSALLGGLSTYLAGYFELFV